MKIKGINFASILFISFFILMRFIYSSYDSNVYEVDLRGIVISCASFPLGILKEEFNNGNLFSIYYYISHILSGFNFELIYRIFNTIISLFTILYFYKIGKLLINKWLGLFLATFLCVNHYFILYSNQITPFSLNILAFVILIYYLFIFLRRFNEKNLNNLIIINVIYCLCDNLGFIFSIIEIAFLIYYFKKKQKLKDLILYKFKKLSYFYFLLFIVFLIQIVFNSQKIIPDNMDNIAVDFNSIYLYVNDFFSPYLSFNSQQYCHQSTMGMIYTYMSNTNIKNINSFKILIALFYASILPMTIFLYSLIKAIFTNSKLRTIFLISISNVIITFILFSSNILEFSPKYGYQFFAIGLIIFGYEIFKIKDIYIKYILIFCLLLIQLVIPDINTYKITIDKTYPTINAFDKFIKEHEINKDDLIVMPYLSNYIKKHYKKLTFFDFDYENLKTKNDFLKNLIEKNDIPINKKNIYFQVKDYLFSNTSNAYFSKLFIENCIKENSLNSRVILAIDKLNSKPVSISTINKFIQTKEYNISQRKINYNSPSLLTQNTSRYLYNSLYSRSLYNLIQILDDNFYLEEIIVYKYIDNKYYKIPAKNYSLQSIIDDIQGDYVFAIYKKRVL